MGSFFWHDFAKMLIAPLPVKLGCWFFVRTAGSPCSCCPPSLVAVITTSSSMFVTLSTWSSLISLCTIIWQYLGPHDFVGLSALTANHVRCHQPIKVNDDPSLRHNILDMSNPDNFLKSTQILKIPTAKHIYTSRQVFQKLIQYIFASSYQQHLHTAHPTTEWCQRH